MQVCKAARFGCSGPAVPRNLEAVAPSRVANGYDAWDSDAGAGLVLSGAGGILGLLLSPTVPRFTNFRAGWKICVLFPCPGFPVFSVCCYLSMSTKPVIKWKVVRPLPFVLTTYHAIPLWRARG
jgi:hypothetical protein